MVYRSLFVIFVSMVICDSMIAVDGDRATRYEGNFPSRQTVILSHHARNVSEDV